MTDDVNWRGVGFVFLGSGAFRCLVGIEWPVEDVFCVMDGDREVREVARRRGVDVGWCL